MKRHQSPDLDFDQDPPSGWRADELAQRLGGSPLFSGMPESEVRDVLAKFDEQSFNAGHRITLEGLRGSDFFVIVDGQAKVSVDDQTIGHLRAGDFFGELGVLGDGLRFATVTTLTPFRCLVLPHGGLKRLLIEHPQMGINVLGQVVNRFHDFADRPVDHGNARAR